MAEHVSLLSEEGAEGGRALGSRCHHYPHFCWFVPLVIFWFNIVLIIKVDALSPYLVSINLYFKVNIILRGTTTVRPSSV